MKLAELLYQNRDKFTLYDDCKWIAQDGDDGFIGQFSKQPTKRKTNINSYGVAYCICSCDIDVVEISDDWETPLSRADYEQYF